MRDVEEHDMMIRCHKTSKVNMWWEVVESPQVNVLRCPACGCLPHFVAPTPAVRNHTSKQ